MSNGASKKTIFIVLATILSCAFSARAQEPRVDTQFFNGKDLIGWNGDSEFWSVEDETIVGYSVKPFSENQFLWSEVEVTDFYLAIDVRLTPNARNAGIQFRSKRLSTDSNLAFGYQADVGRDVWGRLYHEHGRGRLDWTDRGEQAVKPEHWNRYEILAVGHHIWTAINGKLSVAIHDPTGELSGKIALQMHSGQAQKAEYRVKKLVHHPQLKLVGMSKEQLLKAAKTFTSPKK